MGHDTDQLEKIEAIVRAVVSLLDEQANEPEEDLAAATILLTTLLEAAFDRGFHRLALHDARRAVWALRLLLSELRDRQAQCPGCGPPIARKTDEKRPN